MNTVLRFIVHRSPFIVCLVLACSRPAPAPHAIQRVVSLAPNVTEMLFALGCGPKVVGTDNFSDYPEAANKLPRVGGVEPNIEKIVSLHPDLVIASASSAHPNLHHALEAVHVPLMVITTDHLAQVDSSMQNLARALGCPTPSTFAKELEQQRRKRGKPPTILFAVWTDPLYVAGKGSFVDDLFELTGAHNAVSAPGWPQYSFESFAANPPDLLLYPSKAVKREAVDALLRRANVHVEAVAVDDNLFTRPGPRMPIAAATLNHILDLREKSH